MKKLRKTTWRPLPWPARLLVWLLMTLQLILPVAPQLMADTLSGTYSLPLSTGLQGPPAAPKVTINRTLPNIMPPTTDLKFSATPTDKEISRARIFETPIVSFGKTSAAENADLAAALLAYRNRQDPDDASAIENFLQMHPDSPRYLSLSEHLASHYRRTSQFSKALELWPQIWKKGKNVTDLDGRQVVDRAVGDWASFLVTLGRMQELKALFNELKGRPLQGATAVQVEDARNALWQMEHLPTKTFKCGPYSLSRIQHVLDPSAPIHSEILSEQSTTNGTSLYQNWILAQRMGLKYQMARRSSGAEVPLPVMVHWKLGHFSALTKFENGQYMIEDPTFRQGWISPKVLDEESDGYFLIPDGPLPAGWTTVTKQEAETVFGRSWPSGGDPKNPCPDGGCPPDMAKYSVGLMRISLSFFDAPISYIPPLGPKVEFGLIYSERTIYTTGPFTHSNLGNQWGFSWLQYISDNTTQPNANVDLVQGNGNGETFTSFNTNNNTYAVGEYNRGQLTKISGTSYRCLYPDGSAEIYSVPDNTNGARRVFLSQKIDPQGNSLTFQYDSLYRLTNVVDAIGQITTLSYELANDIYKITKVTDPFGRSATFQYNSSGQLTNVTDVIGISSAYTYGASGEADFINSLTTPYGTTTFVNSNADFNGRWIQVTDPQGEQERYEFLQGLQGINNNDPANLVPTGLNPNRLNLEMYWTMSFFWDKKTMEEMNGTINFYKAKQYNFDRTAANFYTLSRTLEATKEPLENARTWYGYPGQTEADQEGTNNQPSIIARVLDDGTTQATRYQRNALGKPTQIVDPSNRTNILVYSTNNIDLLTVGQIAAGVTNVLAQYTYNSQHQPLTSVDAAGQTNFYGYNAYGQLVAMTNALNETVLLNYDTNGYLTNIVAGSLAAGPLSTNSFTYDGYGRVRTTTDPLGYTVTTSYDAADRPTNITYMDGSYQQTVYNYLDPALERDRNGHWTSMVYDPLRHLTDTYDNLGRHTHFDWCNCGSLTGITDPLGNVTQFIRDLQSRVITKIYPDLTAINYTYETNSSRLKMVTDAKGQQMKYQYYIDNNLKQVLYTNTAVATPTVSFTYDTNYNRMTTMTDGTGTTTYSYYPVAAGQFGAGQLSSVSNSFIGPTSLIAYNYDALGRITNRAINGVAQQVAYDDLGRVTLVTNVLGSFTNTYLGGTMLLSTNFYPNGQKTVFSYQSDERLSEIWNQKADGSTLSKFDYNYDAVGNITNWTQQIDANTPTAYSYGYDAGNQVINAVLQSTGAGASILKQYAYNYDLNGNRTGEQIGTTTNAPVAVSQSSYNNLNQVTNRATSSGQLQFAGSLSKQGNVTIAGNAATMNHLTTNFVGTASVSSGSNAVQLIATDYGNHSRTNNYGIMVTNNGVAETIQYDANGNMTNVVSATFTNSYQWDAANRLVSITDPTNESLFAYDGYGRRVQIIELTNGVAYTTNKFIWDKLTLSEQRDLTGATVTKRFFGEGEQINGISYYFTRDRLGSVKEMTDNTATIQARYDYDPYGRQTKLSGTMDADFGYAGMFVHWPSGLNLTWFRAYNADLGRWISPDPYQELGGLNLYEYVNDNPLNRIDPLGLLPRFPAWAGWAGGIAALLAAAGSILMKKCPSITCHEDSCINCCTAALAIGTAAAVAGATALEGASPWLSVVIIAGLALSQALLIDDYRNCVGQCKSKL